MGAYWTCIIINIDASVKRTEERKKHPIEWSYISVFFLFHVKSKQDADTETGFSQ